MMTTLSTSYRIGRVEGDSVMWAREGDAAWNGTVIRCDWHWTGDVKRATRFRGRKAAITFAERAEAWMKRNGHDVALSIFPANGGNPIER